ARLPPPRGSVVSRRRAHRGRQRSRRTASRGRRSGRAAKTIPKRRLPMTNLLQSLIPADEEAQRRLRHRLAAAAEDTGLLDVAYRTLETPVGTLLLAATPKGL